MLVASRPANGSAISSGTKACTAFLCVSLSTIARMTAVGKRACRAWWLYPFVCLDLIAVIVGEQFTRHAYVRTKIHPSSSSLKRQGNMTPPNRGLTKTLRRLRNARCVRIVFVVNVAAMPSAKCDNGFSEWHSKGGMFHMTGLKLTEREEALNDYERDDAQHHEAWQRAS